MTKQMFKCPKCEGRGEIRAFSNVMGGVCFKCHGSGSVATRPAKPSRDWMAISQNGDRVFNCRAKTEKDALKKAESFKARNNHLPFWQAVESMTIHPAE